MVKTTRVETATKAEGRTEPSADPFHARGPVLDTYGQMGRCLNILLREHQSCLEGRAHSHLLMHAVAVPVNRVFIIRLYFFNKKIINYHGRYS